MSTPHRISLHWSFDYNHNSQKPDFANAIIAFLQEYQIKAQDVAAGQNEHTYRILPNFWRGYRSKKRPEDPLEIGSAVIQRHKKNNSLWYYHVQYENTTSGENLRLQFQCNDDCYRTLTDNWKTTVSNDSQDIYSNIEFNGALKDNRHITLRYNKSDITIGTADAAVPVTCNWVLYDVIPANADSLKTKGTAVDIALLDDLEKFRPKCKIGYLDSIQDPIPLDGYYLYGTGRLPSYWWVDAIGNVVIVSTVFETMVLDEFGGSST